MSSFKYHDDPNCIDNEFACCRQEIVDALNKLCINFTSCRRGIMNFIIMYICCMCLWGRREPTFSQTLKVTNADITGV